jgi:primosomal protein N' (replication factor Y)
MDGSAPTGRIAQLLLPLPLPEPFDYAVPEAMDVAVGDLVAAPLGPRTVVGVVVAIRDGLGGNRPLRAILERLDEPPLPARTLEFVQWAARYAVDSPGQPLAIALRGLRAPKPKPRWGLKATGVDPVRLTEARRRVLAAAERAAPAASLAKIAEVSSGVVRALLAEGCLAPAMLPCEPAAQPISTEVHEANLNPSQAAAAAALTGIIAKGGFGAALLDGVTGSGKTEVYLVAADEALRADPRAQVLILLPEIVLTQAVIDRFEKRFGFAPSEWHSGIPAPLRRRTFEAVAKGEARIVVGARSALFLPFVHLRLIVVDEEHDGAYKQEEGFIYHGRDLAVTRARIEDCAVVLASATPSLETLQNAQSQRYQWLRLADRHGGAGMPKVELVDMRPAPPASGAWLSPVLIEALGETLARGEQSLLFLNRRGYAPMVLCRACGERLKSPDSHSWLVEHRYTGRLVCHLTGFSMPKPKACPSCGAADSLVSIGPGVERVEEEARALFPEARLALLSSDTIANPAAARELISDMAAGAYDILVATQMAAKGHDFPNLTLVGVVDADLGLRGGDLRAAERTYQLLTQVSGRAGRRERTGRALIQTWAPEHPVMQALEAGDRDAFIAIEMAERQAAGLPPFTRLAAVIVSGADPVGLEAFVRAAAAVAPNAEGVDLFGPAEAPFALVRGRWRKRFLVRAPRSVDLQGYLAAWRARMKAPASIRVVIDVDPYSFL